MSMHEIEALTEVSIRLLDRAPDLDHRSLFKSLYGFEASFDTGFTRFRLMDLLLKRRFAYQMALEDHPEYEQFKQALEAIRTKDFEHVHRDPSAEWHREKNPAVAYWSKGQLYCEAGSEIWQKLVDRGRFTGADAMPPAAIDVVDVVATLLPLAFGDGHPGAEVLAWWYAALAAAIIMGISSRDSAVATSDPALRAIRGAVAQSKAYEIGTDWGDLRYPPRESLSDPGSVDRAFMEWWFEPLWTAPPRTARDRLTNILIPEAELSAHDAFVIANAPQYLPPGGIDLENPTFGPPFRHFMLLQFWPERLGGRAPSLEALFYNRLFWLLRTAHLLSGLAGVDLQQLTQPLIEDAGFEVDRSLVEEIAQRAKSDLPME